jgi:hypothetical protein
MPTRDQAERAIARAAAKRAEFERQVAAGVLVVRKATPAELEALDRARARRVAHHVPGLADADVG